jgi:hypothetical protein
MALPKRAAVRPFPYEPNPPFRQRGQEPIVMIETPNPNSPVFYACTAASPDGPPIEIAWATRAFESYGVLCESHLIRPPATWISELVCNASSLQALQPCALTLADLRDFGMSPRELVVRMNEVLVDRELFSATAEDDARIRKIFDTVNSVPAFTLRRSDADELITELARMLRHPPTAIARAKREAQVMCLTGIRAEAKVRFLVTYWDLAAASN